MEERHKPRGITGQIFFFWWEGARKKLNPVRKERKWFTAFYSVERIIHMCRKQGCGRMIY